MANKRSIDWLIDQHTPAEEAERKEYHYYYDTYSEFFWLLRISRRFIFRKHKTLFRSLRSLTFRHLKKTFSPRSGCQLFFSERPVLIVDWVCFCCCCFFHAGQRIWYLTSASFKSFITVFIVIRGDCWWQATSLKYKNHSTAVSVGSPLKVHNPLFSVGK